MDQIDSPPNLSPEPAEHSFHQSDQSFDFLVSKHLIPPPLMLLPKPVNHKPKSLTPMLPLPAFVGIIPNFQPLDKPLLNKIIENDYMYNWIGEAFENVVYRKYEEQSYKKIDNVDQNWNIWACDLSKMGTRKSADDASSDHLIASYYTPTSKNDPTLIFQSRFECGNLSMASKVTDREYNLLLQNDINTNGYSQWFFFKVSNGGKGETVKFNILNQYKANNLYKMGMKIVIYSKRESEEKNVSWHRGGENIQYYQNGYSKSSNQYKPYFTLSWDYTFSHEHDEVYFAYNYPYTYSNLENFIFKVESDIFLRNICQRSSLCKTLAGNHVDILTITEHHPYQEVNKGYIIITSRIHPGESVSSYVCNGILEFLLSNNTKAQKLRRNFIFKIIPMLNPDGVIHGNYRSNISGYDLNKKWENPSKVYHPEIYYLKKMIVGLQEMGEVLLFCDLHGHSMKKNAFVYGCHDSKNPRKGKQFPLLISKLFKGFSFKDCSFLDKQEKEGTSRTFLSRELNHCDIFALESSFCGPEYQNIHFTVKHFEELGEKFCEALLIYFKDRIKEMQVEAAMKDKEYFSNQDSSFDSTVGGEKNMHFATEMDESLFAERVNSETSQLSEGEEEQKNVLEERTIKKYLMMKYMRPQTSALKRNNIFIRKSMSKDFTNKIKLSQYVSIKSNSPLKKRDLYQSPNKQDKPKIIIKFTIEKKQIQPKTFQPIDILPIMQKHKNHRSVGKFADTQKITRNDAVISNSTKNIKIVMSKNVEKEKEESEPVFRNTFLKGLPRDEYKSERKMNEFIIKKNKVAYTEDKNSINLFHSVLSSLRKDKK